MVSMGAAGQDLVGRHREVSAVLGKLSDPHVRLVTLAGSGGIGKTEVARSVMDSLTAAGTPIASAELSDCTDAPSVEATVHAALDRIETDKRVCFVIDGLERAHPQLRSIMADVLAHPQVSVLATSRIATGLSIEHLYVLGPLESVAETGDASDGGFAQDLFVQHAERFVPRPALAASYRIVSAIARRLGGHPLAIVIAATQLSTLSLGALLDRLQQGFAPSMQGPSDLPERHATLARAFADDLNWIESDDLACVRALTVFEGSIDLADAESIAAAAGVGWLPGHDDPDAVYQSLRRLAHHSLLTAVLDRPMKALQAFRMAPVTRDVLRAGVTQEDSEFAARVAHAHLQITRVSTGAEEKGVVADGWMKRIDESLDDIRSAERFLIATADEGAVELAAGMRNYWLGRGLIQEGLETLEDVLALPGEGDPVTRTRALETRALLTGAAESFANALDALQDCADRWQRLGEPVRRARTLIDVAAAIFEADGFDRALPIFEEALQVLDKFGDRWWAARARSLLGASAASTGTHRELARAALDAAIEDFRSLGDKAYTNIPLQQLARLFHEEGHDAQAMALLHEGLRLATEVGDPGNASIYLNLLADVELARGQPTDAAAHYLESLKLAAEIAAKPRFIWCLEGLATCFSDLGEPQYAARLVGLSSGVRSALSLRDWVEFPARAIDLSSVPARLSPESYEMLRTEGRLMAVGDVLAYAPELLADQSRRRSGVRIVNPGGLTNREVEVLRLISGGMTSKAIAAELFISIETVGRHISNLYRKINVSGRAEATAYAIKAGLA